MRNLLFFFLWATAIVLMILSNWHEELQFVTIMCGIFAIISKTND